MIAPRSGAATLLPNGKVLVVGGSAAGASAAIYDPAARTWSSTSPMNFASGNSITATLLTNGQVLVVGGTTTNWFFNYYIPHSTSEVYDPVTDKWIPTGYNPTTRTWAPVILDPNATHYVSGPVMTTVHNDFTATLLPTGKVLVAGGAGSASELYDPATGTWRATGSLTAGRSGNSATLLSNGKVLVVGGEAAVSRYGMNSCEIYDPATELWSQAAPMQNSRTGHTMTLLPNGQLLVTGGWSSSFNAPNVTYSGVEVYDPSTGTWAPDGPLTTARSGHTATLLPNGKLLVAGGGVIATWAGTSYYSSTLSSAEIYDAPGGRWTATGSMVTSRSYHTASLLTNRLVVVAGGADSTSTELYDSSSGTWRGSGSLNIAREFHTATVLPNGRVLVAGGARFVGPTEYVSSTELYDPVAGRWATANSMHDARGAHTATLLPTGKVLVAGGIWDVDNPYQTCYTESGTELFDSGGGTWTVVNSMTTSRALHTATLLPNGKVLVAGGVGSDFHPLSSAEIYNPANGMWAVVNSMTTTRASHTATLLTNGKVLVAGGVGASAELYDPAGGTWTATGTMVYARTGHTATLLPGGKVLVAGGAGSIAELYDPATGTWSLVSPMINAHANHTATMLFNGEVLVVGGAGTSAELYQMATGTVAPIILTRAAILPSGVFHFSFSNNHGSIFTVLASTNIAWPFSNWNMGGVAMEVSPGQFQFTDLQSTNKRRCFYRVTSP